MVTATDSQLMERYALGDGNAFDELFRRYERRAYAYFLRRTRSPDASRDLYQDLFLRIHRFRSQFDPSQGFTSWFFTIASHVYIDHLRRCRGFEEPVTDSLADRKRWRRGAPGDRALGGAANPGRPVTRAEAVQVAAKVVGFDYAEIADELGKTVAAVKAGRLPGRCGGSARCQSGVDRAACGRAGGRDRASWATVRRRHPRRRGAAHAGASGRACARILGALREASTGRAAPRPGAWPSPAYSGCDRDQGGDPLFRRAQASVHGWHLAFWPRCGPPSW
jgi:DNA-directed RNA polymerase specialized sigma24 family protein